MKNKSHKHHYLPVHYLKGFTDSNGCFFVYDKKQDKIFPEPLPPTSVFFEKDLNTATFPKGDTSDFLEELYTFTENHAWPSLDNIRNSTSKTILTASDKMELFMFLLFLHWRVPSNVGRAEELSQKFFTGKEGDYNYFFLKSKNGEKVPEKIADEIKNSSMFKKSAKMLLPFAPFFAGDNYERKIANWRFLYCRDGKKGHLVGDSPVITRKQSDYDPVNCLEEFVFPVSGRILLVNTKKPITTGFSPEFTAMFNLAVIERAQRFVAFHDKQFLELLVENYKHIRAKFGRTDKIIDNLFAILDGDILL